MQEESFGALDHLQHRLETYYTEESSRKLSSNHEVDMRTKRVNSEGGAERESAHFPHERNKEMVV